MDMTENSMFDPFAVNNKSEAVDEDKDNSNQNEIEDLLGFW